MTDASFMETITSSYRVVGKTVEKRHKGNWVVAYYCSSTEGAQQRMTKCIEKEIEWSQLSNEERVQMILREAKE